MLARCLTLSAALLALFVAAILTAVAAAAAQDRPLPSDVGAVDGGAFVIQSCGETGSANGWTTTNSDPAALSVGVDCPPSNRPPGFPWSFQQAGVWISDRLSNTGGAPEANAGDRVEATFVPWPGTSITRLRYWRAIHKSVDPGDRWQPYISLSTRNNVIDTCVIGGQSTCYEGGDDWFPNDDTTTNRSSYSDLRGLSASSIIVGLYCSDSDIHTCGNGSSLTHVDAEIFSAFLTISDPAPPTVGTPSGVGWTEDGWSQGTLPLTVASSDVTGISETRVYADGSLVAALQRSCSYDRPRPCSDEPGGAVGVPTMGLSDGPHGISVGAVDAAGNVTRVDRPASLLVDNGAPAAPVSLVSPAPSSTSNRFEAHWSLPADAGSPIVAARYQLCQGTTCGAVRNAPSLTSVDGLALPSAGTGTLRTWLVDALGHEAPAAAATLALSYVPVPAAGAPPTPAPDLTTPVPPDPQATPTPVPAENPVPRPVLKAAPALKIASLRRSGRRITVRGTVSARASGRVTVRFRASAGGHSRTLTLRPAIHARAFQATFTLPRSVARARAGTAVVSYAGDADTSPASRQATIRWRT
jgi:hypothetical protein